MTTLKVHVAAVGHRGTWVAVADFSAASRACREFIVARDFGTSAWRGRTVVDAVTRQGIATVGYHGRMWLARRPRRRSPQVDRSRWGEPRAV